MKQDLISELSDFLSFVEEIVEETIRNRQKLIENLSVLEEDRFSAVYPGERQFTLESYIRAFFTSHDKHHMNQINNFLRQKAPLNAPVPNRDV